MVEEGGATGAIAIPQDFTEYEYVSKELESVKQLQQTLETVLELAYEGIVVVDQEGKIVTVNSAFAEFLGTQPAALIGEKVNEVLHELGLEETLQTGIIDFGSLKFLRGQRFVVTRTPIVRESKVVGAVAKVILRELDRLYSLGKQLEELKRQVSFYKGELLRASGNLFVDEIVGVSPPMRRAKKEAKQAARGFSTVLLLGESGTGKELFSRAIHNESGRPGAFISVNCAAIPDNLLESEFFGYADGAFTGAKKGGKPGKFELADQDTLFLDEIADMSPQLQAKLLRVLQDKEFERIGGIKTIKVNVRIIAATNKNIEQLVRVGTFREDLYYRLNVIRIFIPPLQEHKEDLALLVNYFIQKFNKVMGTAITGISPSAFVVLQDYRWPGNVRELENVLERTMSLKPQGVIEAEDLPDYILGAGFFPRALLKENVLPGLHPYLREQEQEIIQWALEKTKGNRSQAARLLGISRSTLYEKLNKRSQR